MVNEASVAVAAQRIKRYIRKTPVIEVAPNLFLKLEHLQHAGVFKTRGAYNVILRGLENGAILPTPGIVIASGGNAALATAVAAKSLGVSCHTFVPTTAPQAKLSKLRAAGADVVTVGATYQDSYEAAEQFAHSSRAFLSHAYDNEDVVSGAGTIGLELLEQVPGLNTILVSCGGGGLYAGIQQAVDSRVTVIPVEPENCATLANALTHGEQYETKVSGVAADSLGASKIGKIAYETAIQFSSTPVIVSDEAIEIARTTLWQDSRIISEHGAATAFAALLSKAYVPAPDEIVAIVICGANTDPSTL